MLLSLAWVFVGALALMAFAWLQQRRSGNATAVDLYWTLAIGISGLCLLALGDGSLPRRLVLASMLGLWCGRLSLHLARRLGRDQAEDGRYRDLRRRYGERVQGFLLLFFFFQALTVPIFVLPHLLAANTAEPAGLWLFLAPGLFLLALAGQHAADRSLARFRADPARQGVCRDGWWGRCRHPNYFFEWLIGISFAMILLGTEYGVVAWLLPLVEFVLLRFVTGVPPTESQALRSRGIAYADYQRQVPAFFPRLWPACQIQESSS